MKIQRYRRGFPETGAGKFKLPFTVPASLLNCKGGQLIFPLVPYCHSCHRVHDPAKLPLMEVNQQIPQIPWPYLLPFEGLREDPLRDLRAFHVPKCCWACDNLHGVLSILCVQP